VKLAACVEYNGAMFSGWQRQRGSTSVQEVVETALAGIANHPLAAVAAGRTDAGVHASGQVIHFETDSIRSEWSWRRGANALLPRGVTVLWVVPVAESFHARYSAVARRYRYIILNRQVRSSILDGRVAWDYRQLNVDAMQQAARLLVGERDFSAFRGSHCQAKSAVRNLRQFDVWHCNEWIWADTEANGFLQHMVRNLVGALLEVGTGAQEPDWVMRLLDSRDRCQGGVTAPAHGLYLTAVKYPSGFELPPAPAPCRFW